MHDSNDIQYNLEIDEEEENKFMPYIFYVDSISLVIDFLDLLQSQA